MSDREEWKINAAKEAAGLVDDEMTVGLGSGSTLGEVVKALGEKDSGAEFVASSVATQKLAEKMGLKLVSLVKEPEIEIVIDGADEVDPNLEMIKGGGGSHTREKIVASAGDEMNVVVDKTKLVRRLGEKTPVPVEVVPFATDYTEGVLKNFGEGTQLRKGPSGGPFVTDNGNYIIDVEISNIQNPEELGKRLNQVPGTVENGIFAGFADRIFVGYEDGCEVISSKKDFKEFMDRIGL